MPVLLQSKLFLIIDCQTTGMHPSNGHLTELAWTTWQFNCPEQEIIHHYIKLPDGERVPRRISQLTGITDADLDAGLTPKAICDLLLEKVSALGDSVMAISHYANFERNFLRDLFLKQGEEKLPFTLLCSQKISKKLFPNLPSHSLKGILGSHGLALEDAGQRARLHVEATVKVLNVLFDHLTKADLQTMEHLSDWYTTKSLKKTRKLEYNVDRSLRLAISTKPGIYKMLCSQGSILYIGKAASLRSRVNSYFRGQKNRDRRKLEMLSQVATIDTIECDTALEAALLETDEIKKWSPPYNIVLKNTDRELWFYTRDFQQVAVKQTREFFVGPHRANDAVAQLKSLHHWIKTSESDRFIETMFPVERSKQGWMLFCEENKVEESFLRGLSFRSCLYLSLLMLRKLEKHDKNFNLEKQWASQKNALLVVNPGALDFECITPSLLKDRIERVILRAALARRRSRQLTRLMNSSLQLKQNGILKELIFNAGRQNSSAASTGLPWSAATIAEWDRMSTLFSYRKFYTFM